MKNLSGTKSILALLGLILALLVKVQPAEAARSFTVQELNAPQPVEVTMGDPAGTALTYRITNTNTGGDVNKKIYRLRFTAPAGFTFTGASALPAGWAVNGALPAQTITLQTATPCVNCIISTGAGGVPMDFTLTLGAIPAAAQDSVSTVSVQSRYDSGQNKANNGQTFVTRRSLKAALVAYVPSQCTPDCTNWGSTCPATPSIAVTGTHSLALIVQNQSTSTWTGIISNPNPPTAVYSWAGGGPAFTGPASITLAPGACNVVVWTVTMPGKTGTVYYQARARNSTGAATSQLVTSNTVVVASPAAALQQTCVFPGETTTVTMTATNNGSTTLTNIRPWGISTLLNGLHNSSITTITVTPSTAGFPTPAGTIRIDSEEIDYTGTTGTTFSGCTRGAHGTTAASHVNGTTVNGPRPFFIGTATPTYIAGPAPNSIASLASAASGIFTWTYRIDGTGGQTYSFQGFVSAFGTGITSPVITSPTGTLGYFDVTIGSGATLGAGTFNNETTWNLTNKGCDPVNRVDITVPGGFTVLTNGFDSNTGVDPPDWNEAYAGGTVSFTAGTNMLVGISGGFSILFSGLPGTGVYPFPVKVYDTFGRVVTIPTNVTVDTSLPGSGNNKSWEEPTR